MVHAIVGGQLANKLFQLRHGSRYRNLKNFVARVLYEFT